MKFTGYKEISDTSKPTGFDQYLLVSTDYGDRKEAYGIDRDTVMDVETLTREVYRDDCDVSFGQSMCGPNNASIITDGNAPDSVVVWQSRDFYFDFS